MTATMKTLDSFSGQQIYSEISNAYTPLTSSLTAYSSSQILDVSDTSTISDLTYVSNSKNYPSCNKGNLQADSWIPHLNLKDNVVPCLAP
jgi:hypothetical protein